MNKGKNGFTGIIKILIVLNSVFYISAGHAQGFYLSGNTGMAFQAFPTKVETFFNVNNSNNTVRIQQPAFSLGGGFVTNASLGYFFNDYIGVDLGISYQVGSKVLFSQEYVILTQTELKEMTLYARRFSFIPSIIVKAGDGKVQPFFKLGPSFGSVRQYLDEKTTIDTNTSSKYWKYSGPTAVGLNIEAGIYYNLDDNLSFFLSSSYTNMVYNPTRADVVNANHNGMGNSSSLQPFEKTILFVEWSDDPYNAGPQDPDKPTRMQSQSFSYSNISLQLGVCYQF